MTTTHSIFLKFAGGQNLPKGNIEMKLVTTTNATVKLEQQFVSCETERSVQTASCLEAGSNLTTKNWQPILILYQTQGYIGVLKRWIARWLSGVLPSSTPSVHQHLGTSTPQRLKLNKGDTDKTMRQLDSNTACHGDQLFQHCISNNLSERQQNQIVTVNATIL